MADSEFVRHIACESCGSSDANSLYTDQHTHCFACGTTVRGDDALTPPSRRLDVSQGFLLGDFQALTARSLDEATCRKFGYRVGTHNGRPCQIADYRDADGDLVAQKVRYQDKTFSVLGSGANAPLFGQHLWPATGRRIVVTEGEIDAMSVAQAFGLGWPAVSLPNGAQSARKALERATGFLDGYETVVLCFDMDEVGRKAAAECAPIFRPGQCAIAELPLKDANELLQAGRVKDLTSAIYQARVYRPDGIVGLADIRDRVLKPADMGRPWFLPTLSKATYGRRLGEVIALGAGTGIGKTDFFTQSIAHDVKELGITTGVLFLEQGVGETGRRIAGKMAGKRFHVPDGSWTDAELEDAWSGLERTGKLHLYDSWGVIDWPTIKARIRYMVTALGCEHVYLDHMTALAAAEADERVALEKIMAEAATMATGLKFVLHFVSHLATPEGKPHEEGGRVTIRHFKGSRALGFWSHFMLGMERNQQADDASQRHQTTLRVLKDRFTGQSTGLTIPLSYDASTGLMAEGSNPFRDETGTTDF